MCKYIVEISEYINSLLQEGAKMRDIDIESFIADILNKYVVDEHIMDKEEVKRAYEEMGDINIKLSN